MTNNAAGVPLERVAPPEEQALDPATNRARWAAWVITWVAYATSYFGRKGISVAKTSIAESFGKEALVGVETGFLAAYAAGQYVNGFLGDRLGSRRLVGVGLLVSAVACMAFGASGASIAFLLAYTVNGFAQSSGWPGNVKAMAEWTTLKNRARVMGFWATCYQAGGIIATWFATLMLGYWGWRGSFLGPGVVIALVGIVVLLFLKPGPGANQPHEAKSDETASNPIEIEAKRKSEQRRVLKSLTVWCYGGSYFGMKLIRYSLLFWLPYYLTTALGYSKTTAGYMSTSFEIGGVFGTIGMGALSNHYKQLPRSILAAIWLVLLAGATYLYAKIGATDMVTNFAVMALVGALLFGPDSLISGAAAQDAGGPHAAATAAGIVNGIGSLGAILQESVTRGVSERYGWDKLFYVFIGLAMFSAACLVPTFRTRARA